MAHASSFSFAIAAERAACMVGLSLPELRRFNCNGSTSTKSSRMGGGLSMQLNRLHWSALEAPCICRQDSTGLIKWLKRCGKTLRSISSRCQTGFYTGGQKLYTCTCAPPPDPPIHVGGSAPHTSPLSRPPASIFIGYVFNRNPI